jgi:hypothetical protein
MGAVDCRCGIKPSLAVKPSGRGYLFFHARREAGVCANPLDHLLDRPNQICAPIDLVQRNGFPT